MGPKLTIQGAHFAVLVIQFGSKSILPIFIRFPLQKIKKNQSSFYKLSLQSISPKSPQINPIKNPNHALTEPRLFENPTIARTIKATHHGPCTALCLLLR